MESEIHPLLAELNPAQREAVSTESLRVLVLAGAGSGKTRVLVHRMVWLAQQGKIRPHEMMAVTFTNKAANEMRSRVESLLGNSLCGGWTGTFHGLSHRFLRLNWEQAGLPETFQVIDSDDQLRIIKRLVRDMNLDEQKYVPRKIAHRINASKDEGIRSADAKSRSRWNDRQQPHLIRIYHAYEMLCQQSGLVDFGELLLRSYELLQTHPDLLQRYQSRFKLLLVDEFQDTNTIQYRWFKQLVTPETSLFVVGDDDQSIYGWRGARVDNIHRVERDFAPVHLCRLEQNYRSSGAILELANKLIIHNSNRMEKKLWTSHGEGSAINVHRTFNDYEEAQFVVEAIVESLRKDHNFANFAILYRSNAQSRLFEDQLVQHRIPYRIYGGLRFYERAEIKNVLAYLRLVFNRADDAALERVINLPARGIGQKTRNDIKQRALVREMPLWKVIGEMLVGQLFTSRAQSALSSFVELIEEIDRQVRHLSVAECCSYVIELSGLKDLYSQEKGEQGQNKLENLAELVNAAKAFDLAQDAAGLAEDARVLLFLSQTALDVGDEQADDATETVQLMTLHAAKGLEFDTVFLVGMEAGLFPNRMAMDENRLDEERRLCYVGITRAKRNLYLTYASQRRVYGTVEPTGPSLFLEEMGLDLDESEVLENRLRHQTSARPQRPRFQQPSLERAVSSAGSTYGGLRLGQDVEHPTFGRGVVLNLEGSGARARIQVQFSQAGSKWLMCEYAKLQGL